MGNSLSTGSLYPIERDTTAGQIVNGLVVFIAQDGSYELRRAISADERTALEARKRHLVVNLEPARPRDIKADILEMLIGFGAGQMTPDEAAVLAAQYAAVLAGLPAWAIRRACGRWARGEVTAEEIGEKKLNRSFAPSSAQMRLVAEEIIRPHTQEVARISRTLRGKVPMPEVSEQEREATAERIRRMADDAMHEIDGRAARELLAENERKAKRDRDDQERHKAMVRREYEVRGLEPPEPLVTLGTMLAIGWTIETVGNQNVLVSPPKESKTERPRTAAS